MNFFRVSATIGNNDHNAVQMRMPWEPSLEDTILAMQADMRFMTMYTAVLVRSENETLRMVINTERGQVMPEGKCTFKDGTTIEFHDIGMPQVGVPTKTVQQIVLMALDKAFALGLEAA